ncbi:MAG TPA: type II toxin-antitoxin system RatA family toxin [Steroidobacteraceae bacterium]|nr:type II toxin-antitoxin system RatA family toxin [Steroidobacteraceae bacterium]
MRKVERTALVALPPARIYALINDIEAYPTFVPGCEAARVESRTEREIVATLHVHKGPLHTEFTTRNELEPDRAVRMRLVRGPFRLLEGDWILTPIESAGCRIDLSIRFAFSNPISGALFEPLFQQTVISLVDAFVARARMLDD